MTIKTKVLVVGGGPAGSTAASVLATEGTESVLLEKNLSFEKPCGGGIPSLLADSMKIPPQVICSEVSRISLFSPGNNSVDVDLAPYKIFIVDRKSFDRSLREKARSAGADLVEGAFIDTEMKNKYFISTIKTAAGVLRCQSEFIVAADGVNSRVRASQRIRIQRALFTISERTQGVATDACEFWFSSHHSRGFYSWVFPAGEGISVGTGDRRPRDLRKLLDSFIQRRGLGERPSHFRVYRIPQWDGELYNKNKIIFAGDSAGQVMPLSYEGIYYAVKSGELAARAVLQGNAGTYKKMWKSDFFMLFFILSKLNAYFLKSDASAEKMVDLHKHPEVQQAAKALWLRKEHSAENLRSYAKHLGRFLI